MPSENVQWARRGYEAFGRGDMDEVLEFIDADIEVHEGRDLPDGGVLRTHDGFLESVRTWAEVFEELDFEPEEFVEAEDQLLVVVRVSGRGRGSGAGFDQTQVHLWTVRDGKAIRLEFFSSRAEAEKAAGLRA